MPRATHYLELSIDGKCKQKLAYPSHPDSNERAVVIGKLLEALRCADAPQIVPIEVPVARKPSTYNGLSPLYTRPKNLDLVDFSRVDSDSSRDAESPQRGGSLVKLTGRQFIWPGALSSTKRYQGSVTPALFTDAVALAPHTLVWNDTRNGAKVDRWREKVTSGQNATGNLSAFRLRCYYQCGSRDTHWKTTAYGLPAGEHYDCWTGLGQRLTAVPTAASDSGLLSKADSGALKKLNGRINALKRDADIGESLAEFGQTLRMIRGPLAGAMLLVRDGMRKGRALQRAYRRREKDMTVAERRIYAKAAGQVWLEFVFGWIPLVKEIEAVLHALQTSRNKIGRKKISASFKTDKTLSSGSSVGSKLTYSKTFKNWNETAEFTVRYQLGINPVELDAVSQMERIGLSPERFIPTIYAVLPYSWLFDYFTGFNHTVDALCADMSFKTWASRGEHKVSRYQYVESPDFGGTAKIIGANLISDSGSPEVFGWERRDFVRSTPTNLVPVPTLSLPKTWKPYANIVALLASRIVVGNRKTLI